MIINRCNDALIKYTLAKPDWWYILLSCINAVFANAGKPLLTDITLRDRELSPNHLTQKGSRLDVLCQSADGTSVNVEVQIAPLRGVMPKRSLFYWARDYTKLPRGKPYTSLTRTVCIVIMLENLFTDKETPLWHNMYVVANAWHPSHILTDDLEIHFLEVPKWHKQRPPLEDFTSLDAWMAFFCPKTTPQELEALPMIEPAIADALEAHRRFMADPALVQIGRAHV